MALSTYAGLKAAALAWIDHANVPGATNIIDDCVTLCEARINKTPTLRLSTMETEATLTGTNGSAELPADFLAIKRVVSNPREGEPAGGFDEGFDEGFDAALAVPSSYRGLLTYAEPSWWYGQAYPSGFYTIVGTRLHARVQGTIGIVYYAKVPPLATTDANWLLSKAPDVYLYGTILELLTALEGDAAGKYAGLYNAAVEALIGSETFSRGGVLTMRASMPAP